MSLYFHTWAKERPLNHLFAPEKKINVFFKIPFHIFRKYLEYKLNRIELNEDFKEIFIPMTPWSKWIWLHPYFFVWKINAKNKLHGIRCGIGKVSLENANAAREFPEMAWLYCSFPSHTQNLKKKKWELPHTHRENICYHPNHMMGLSQLIYLNVKISLLSKIRRINILVDLCMHISKATSIRCK